MFKYKQLSCLSNFKNVTGKESSSDIWHLIISPEHGSQFEMQLNSLTRSTARNMVKRGTFFLNWDFTEIGMQTPIIHMNLQNKCVILRNIFTHYCHSNSLVSRILKVTNIISVSECCIQFQLPHNNLIQWGIPAMMNKLSFYDAGCQLWGILYNTCPNP